ncbi:hypothetical protein [Vagococcus humatus]|nr:hypothetical protein [Vagococcus humatus]
MDCLPPEAKHTIVVLSSNLQQAYEWTGLILKTKNKVARKQIAAGMTEII